MMNGGTKMSEESRALRAKAAHYLALAKAANNDWTREDFVRLASFFHQEAVSIEEAEAAQLRAEREKQHAR
jgi:hypothetical protein